MSLEGARRLRVMMRTWARVTFLDIEDARVVARVRLYCDLVSALVVSFQGYEISVQWLIWTWLDYRLLISNILH